MLILLNQQNDRIYKRTPYQHACKKYGREKVINKVINRIKESCNASTSAGTNNTHIETSLLVSAITDEAIHIHCLYLLLRNNPEALLLMLQQHLHQQQLEERDGQTVAKLNTDNNNID